MSKPEYSRCMIAFTIRWCKFHGHVKYLASMRILHMSIEQAGGSEVKRLRDAGAGQPTRRPSSLTFLCLVR